MRIVLVGPPGAGKGTQAGYLAKALSIPHISTGDLFRANISQGTELGLRARRYSDQGRLVPDEVTIGMAEQRLREGDAAEGFLLDGFPRNIPQADALDAFLAGRGLRLDGVLELDLPDDEVVRRIAGRRVCRTHAAHLFHVTEHPPAAEGVCDLCGGELYQRSDDAEDKVRVRLEEYHSKTEPIIGHYRARDLLLTISASGTVGEVTERAMAALGVSEAA